jgi:hypothetical protein
VPVVGVTVIEFTVGTRTVTIADADFVVSATLVAVTVAIPAVAPAVNRPAFVIVPEDADHVTALFVTFPFTVALSCIVPLVRIDPVAGVTLTEFTIGAATVTVAVPAFVVSATLVAVTVTVAFVVGDVSNPMAEIVPAEVFQVTALLVTVPRTAAVNCCEPPV